MLAIETFDWRAAEVTVVESSRSNLHDDLHWLHQVLEERAYDGWSAIQEGDGIRLLIAESHGHEGPDTALAISRLGHANVLDAGGALWWSGMRTSG